MARLKRTKRRRSPKTPRRSEYHALAAKVDAFFERVQSRYGGEMRCAAGCSECCSHHFTVSLVEAEDIRQALVKRSPEERARLAARAESLGNAEGPCPALDADGRCAIYEARPLICRSHGTPMHVPASAALPVLGDGAGLEDGSYVRCCHLNFTGRALETVDPSCVLDLVNMAATLAVVNARATPDGQAAALRRVLIGDVLRAAHSP